MSLVLLPLTRDWFVVLLNIHGGRTGPLYSLPEAVILAIPIIAWLGRDQAAHTSKATP